jgi:hypothetical protein
MSHSIPVFFFLLDCSEAPSRLESWSDAEQLIGSHYSRQDDQAIWSSVSRNWWHQDAVAKISQKLNIAHLEFTMSEVALLQVDELETAAESLDSLLSSFAGGVPDLGPIDSNDGTLWWLARGIEDNEVIELSSQDVQVAFQEARASRSVDEGSVVGYRSLVGFFSFLKSLRQALGEAMDGRKCLLYVRPQP